MVVTKVSVVVPAKDEGASLVDLLPELISRYPEYEVIVVDDGSSDDTAEIAVYCGAKLVQHKYGKGNGAAIKSGARAASGDILVFMDADGQHKPEEVEALVQSVENGYDMAVGARQKGDQASLGRSIGNKFYNFLASYMTGHQVEDLTSGFRAVRRDKFLEFLYLLPNGFSYPTTITMAFFRAGYSTNYILINVMKRVGESHLKPIRDGIRFFLIIFKIGTLYSPLKIYVPFAMLLFAFGLGWYGYTFVDNGRFTNMSALLMTSGIIVFMMGLISEQITAMMYKDKT